ncbi:hypothetical protein G9A89_003580 [Geosiphon pyriformis]|nr:hypothetical protein G9A89_003580 [Geosiphon pyriformis]
MYIENGINLLPPEILSQVFRNLQGDSKSLFSCLLVSRAWCRQVVPILWSSPLRYGCVKEESSGFFIESLLSCLNLDEREELRVAGINLDKPRKPFFEYTNWIREFDFKSLDIKVSYWFYNHYLTNSLNYKSAQGSNNSQIAAVTTQLSKLITNRSPLLTSFWLTKRDSSISTQSLPDFTTFHRLDFALRRFEHVYLHGNFDEFDEQDIDNVHSLLSAMKVVCRNIQILEIEFRGCTDLFERHVEGLIRLQKGLEEVAFDDISAMQTSAIAALASQSHSLITLEFRSSCLDRISLSPLSNCTKLKTLVFDECEMFPDDFWRPLLCSQIKLEKLHLRDNHSYGNLEDLISLIQKCGPSLRELQLIQPSIPPTLLHTVAQCCPNLTHLDVLADPSLTTALQHVLSRCDQLTYFSLRGEDDENINCDELLPALIEGFPESVRHVNLYFPVTATALSTFLRVCGGPLRKLGLHQVEGISDECVKLLAEYGTSPQASKDLIIGIDQQTLQFKCDKFLVENLKKSCRYTHVLYSDANLIPSF